MSVVLPDASGGAQEHEVDVSAPLGATLGDLRRHLSLPPRDVMVERPGDRAAVAVDDSSPLGRPPLVDGCTVAPQQLVLARSPTLLRIDVLSGPHAGLSVPLPAGSHLLGRSAACSLVVRDPTVSRVHLSLTVQDGTVLVRDVSSGLTATVNGKAFAKAESHWTIGATVRVGDSELRLSLPQSSALRTESDGLGGLVVNRPPRQPAPDVTTVIEMPAPPSPRDKPTLAWAGIVVPLLAGGAFLLISPGQTTFLLFLLLSPLMALLGYVGERRHRRRAHVAAHSDFTRRTSAAQARLAAALSDERSHRLAEAPDASFIFDLATLPTADLWHRQPRDTKFLSARVGVGRQAAYTSVVQLTTDGNRVPLPQTVDGTPLVIDLSEGPAGVVAHPAASCLLPQWIVAQLLALHSPIHLRVFALCAEEVFSDAWSWLAWSPHEAVVAKGREAVRAYADELATRLKDGRAQHGATDGAATLVVLHGARALRHMPAVARLLAEGASIGVHCLCIEDDETSLPLECATVVRVDDGRSVHVRRHSTLSAGSVDEISPWWLHNFVRALAPLRDATPSGDHALPRATRLADLLDVDPSSTSMFETHWDRAHDDVKAVIGAGASGPVTLDLRLHGPHVLVAGTTGAGKSELLQTLVASLAVSTRPDQLTFVLVDYKGGAAFAQCANLPHVVGMVTDLDSALTQRALTSLTAELKRREHLLAAAGMTDLDSYIEARRTTPLAPIARLVLMVDEFATLKEELPDFVDGLVGVAQRGRSLGVHLVLATQRPSGVISPNIRANTNARIALRMTDAVESVDVIDDPAAASLSPTTPGRALMRVGGGPLTAFQTARVTGRQPEAERICVTALGGPPADDTASAQTAGTSDLALLVASAQKAWQDRAGTTARAPWLPPLPDVIDGATLQAVNRRGLPFGLADLPTEQTQPVAELDLDAGQHLLIVGAPRSGRSTMLRTLAAEASRRDDVHLYAFDFDGVLAELAGLAGCGAVVARDEPTRGQRLLTRLLELLRNRRSLPDVAEAPRLLLLVDGWDRFVTTYDDHDNGAATSVLLQVLREGPAAGLTSCITGDRSALTGRLAAMVTQRLVLRMADSTDVALAGISPKAVPTHQPPGRGLHAPSGDAVQIATPRPLSRVLPRMPPLRVAALPDVVTEADVAPAGGSPLHLSLGLGGDDAQPVTVDLAVDGPALLVCGPARSGRSSLTVMVLGQAAARGTRTLVVAGRRSPLSAAADAFDVPRIALNDAAGLQHFLDGEPLLILVDDSDEVTDSAIEPCLADVVRTDSPHAGAVGIVLTAETSTTATAFRGLGALARKGRTGVVLMPTGAPDDGLLGRRVGPCDNSRPGRGVFVVGSEVTPLQVAHATGR